MKTMFTTIALFGLAFTINAQEKPKDSVQGTKIELNEVLVSAIRVTNTSPVTFSNLSKEKMAPRNLGQDIPVLLNYLPGVVTTSDAGAGIGYTGIRVRGSDATRVNVTINGIPYNDSESQGTFWVNMPDFASSTQNIQLQRGVGTSTNGSGAFGASLNVLTDAVSDATYAQVSSGVGSFNTLRNTVKFSTGVLNNHIEIAGRLSQIKSDGYVDRASSDLDAYFLQAAYTHENTLLKALIFGGHEVTYQSWNGIDAATLATDRTFNSAGMYTDAAGNTQFYNKEEDNYKQDHAQLLWNQKVSEEWSTNLALHYTRGRGYFEQYKEDESFADYGFAPYMSNGALVNETDVIRRRWLDNDFFGTTFSVQYKTNDWDIIVGGAANRYEGAHFGEVLWTSNATNVAPGTRYYDDNSVKTALNTYTKATHVINDKLTVYGDLQLRAITYSANGNETGLVDDAFTFFNPKAGLVYKAFKHSSFYASIARANREPNRNDYENGNPEPEQLDDFELGWRFVKPSTQINANLYYMAYKNQLVLTGALNDVGAPLRKNIGDSFRLGLEIDANFSFSDKVQWSPNIAISTNKNRDFVFQRDGQLSRLGNTNIAFSPNVVAGSMLTYMPVKKLQVGLLSKYVGEQYMGNIDAVSSKLKGYSQSDLNVTYSISKIGFAKSIVFSALINNIFNTDIVSNGYFFTYDDDFSDPNVITTIEGAGYYPQAGTNYLLGATVIF